MISPDVARQQKIREKIWLTAYLCALRRLPPHRAEQEADQATRIYGERFSRLMPFDQALEDLNAQH